jgi:hypothetical protein
MPRVKKHPKIEILKTKRDITINQNRLACIINIEIYNKNNDNIAKIIEFKYNDSAARVCSSVEE